MKLRGWLLCCSLCVLGAHAADAPLGRLEEDGVRVRVGAAGALREGADMQFVLNLSAGDTPLRGARPAAWLDRVRPGKDERSCRQKAAALVEGGWLHTPALDLNTYYVLALNAEPSISVINPLSGFGGSKLLALVDLHAPGADWVQTGAERLLVSMPQAGEVALVDTRNWKVLVNTAVGTAPSRLLQQPGRAGPVWVATGEGVAVLDANDGKLLARIATSSAPDSHEIAFSADGMTAFVSNRAAGNVSVIDTAARRQVALVATGAAPASVAWSAAARLAYVTHGDGAITALDTGGRLAAQLKSAPGLGQIRFGPDGRYGLILNGATGDLLVLDAATSQIVQNARIGQAPDHIIQSDRMAYIRRQGSAQVGLIPLDSLGRDPGQAVQAGEFAGGQLAPGKDAMESIAAAPMAPAPNGVAMLVANPADKAIYYYQEGMAAPMGSFSNYNRVPRAVMVVDRSLQEQDPGEYRVGARLPAAGEYELVLLLDAPRVLHCFPVSIAAPLVSGPAARREIAVELGAAPAALAVHRPQRLQFRISEGAARRQVAGVRDLTVMLVDAPGLDQTRLVAQEQGDGLYSVEFSPASAGLYFLHFQSASLGLRWTDPVRYSLVATD